MTRREVTWAACLTALMAFIVLMVAISPSHSVTIQQLCGDVHVAPWTAIQHGITYVCTTSGPVAVTS